ncbi:nucleoside 2-deoxyribosyltransferase [Tetragenococcus koreensis]|uniref:Nucleoside 2-deoxyribosyltransferase n=1 Tax=Tetragenococcus koreensis TaxID=290335 RepID=A0AAN4UAX9_9ENTE|nr:nucleoside 2-deoxyribosyltransferase [Tetragenococcus koreensis]AYW44700.1 nucleoside 2-deoxyribosyltransferase [Tetragenococcus koreensis]MCF1584188.1 nucleoside 2-deoxyribosyltransferase [Tetragenococcus koreensis]MCF1613679.1 nucleoside 2-deoxyribosyltransferase [Tetragenococcus koreensis]MCF1616280.1 nucleoside 2-deoxyribosyltransferase [Tetragenococcus koreensis]MCF1618998.1 nucleoside 2-deoxyribosyltransferase [Tetragenococcus koreensis]
MGKDKQKQPLVKVYLGTPYFNEEQKKRVEKAKKALEKNDTVAVIHFPFDFQYKEATLDDPKEIFGTLTWQNATYQNDLSAMSTADCGVFLYDLDQIDDGSAFEIGFMRALHKPVLVFPFSKELDKQELNLMIARGTTNFIDSFEKLSTYDFNHFPSEPQAPIDVF